MADREGIFAGDDPFQIAQTWLDHAHKTEPNDPNAMALATVGSDGMPDVRMVLLKQIERDAFVFYTNYDSAKGRQIKESGNAAFVIHWKSLRRQIRVRGRVTREDGPLADEYYRSRALQSRIGAWASQQSRVLSGRAQLVAEVAQQGLKQGLNPDRPPYWGGFRIHPVQIEFWADGAFRLHDRIRWDIQADNRWQVQRLYP